MENKENKPVYKDVKGANYQLLHGDCLVRLKELPDNSIDSIVTDPPYGVGFKNSIYNDEHSFVKNKIDEWIREVFRLLKDGSHLYVFVPTLIIDEWLSCIKSAGFKFNNIITTRCKSNNYTKNNFKYDVQFVVYFSKGKANLFNKINIQKTSSMWAKDKRNKNVKEFTYCYSSLFNEFSTKLSKLQHPNQKSEDFISKLIRISTPPNGTVLDMFNGSGSTGKAAIREGFKYIGCEMDEEYIKISAARIDHEQKKVDAKKNKGEVK